MLFLKTTFIWFFGLCFGTFILAWQLGIIDEKDKQAYLELASLSNLKAVDAKSEPYSAKQDRYKIVKEFYLEKKLIQLKSRTSSLVYEQKDVGKEIVEKMSDVVCLIQEEVYALLPDGRKAFRQPNGKFLLPEGGSLLEGTYALMQEIGRVRCANANYHYQTQKLEAEDVIVERYTLPGAILPDNFEQFESAFNATAKHILFSFRNSCFYASEIEAVFNEGSEPIHLSSKDATYLDKCFLLQGDVFLNHPLGTSSSQEATISIDDQSQITAIDLQKDIQLSLKDEGCLTAESAVIDCVAKKGIFLSSGKVCFFGEDGLSIESKNMNVAWEDTQGSSAKHMISLFTAEQEVIIQYNGNIYASGDFARYTNDEIFLKSLQEENLCKVVFDKQNHILANPIILYPQKKQAVFLNSHGFINREKEKVLFSAKVIEYDDALSQLVLKENVEVEEAAIGVLKTDGSVILNLKEEEGRKKLSRIECEGDSFFVHTDEKKEEHCLTTNGKFALDHELFVLTVVAKEGEKITYKDHHGRILANKVTLRYSQEGKMSLEKLYLEDDICIVNQFTEAQNHLLQYIVADLAEYSFIDRELTLSQKENRVLFYDKINDIELSAPKLKIKRDVITNKDSVKGVGDVRFVFATQELEKVKNRFKFSETIAKDPIL